MAHDYTQHLKTEMKAQSGGRGHSPTLKDPVPASGLHYTQALSPIPRVPDGLRNVRSYDTQKMVSKGLLTLGLVIFYKAGLHEGKKRGGLNELFEVKYFSQY